MAYRTRLVDAELDELMDGLPAIALVGPKGVGKTETARRRAAAVVSLDDPARRRALEADPGLLSREIPPVLVDEWQLLPVLWDVVRRRVDADPTPGSFLLTGSAVPPQDARIHSGAGRIVRLAMRPMGLSERGLESPSVSLAALLGHDRPVIAGTSHLDLADYAEEILASGLPGVRTLPPRARRAQLDSYLGNALDVELPEIGVSVRRPAALRAWLSAYAAATATTASYATILDAATPGEHDKPSRTTVTGYREALTRLYLLDPVEAWTPSFSRLGRLGQAPRHHLADPALAAALLGVRLDALLRGEGRSMRPRDGTLLGSLFESLAALTVRPIAQACEARMYHLRTRNGDHEVDLIVERADGSVVALEVKLAADVGDRDVRHLRWLGDQIGDRLLDRVVLTTGRDAYRRPDGIAVVPLALLGP